MNFREGQTYKCTHSELSIFTKGKCYKTETCSLGVFLRSDTGSCWYDNELIDIKGLTFELVDELNDDLVPFKLGDKVTATVTTGDIKKDKPYTVESILFDDKGVYQGVKLAETQTLLHRTLVELYKPKYPVNKGDLVKSLVNWASLKKGYIYQVESIETSDSDFMGVWVYADNEDLDSDNTHYLTKNEFRKWSDNVVGTVSFKGTTKDVINQMKEYIEHHDY